MGSFLYNCRMPKNKPKVYIGCALTLAPNDFVKDIEKFKKKLRPYAEIFDFLGLQPPDAGQVFQHDTNCVRRCDLMIANVTYPSIGLGLELGVAVENRKPLITLAQKNIKVSRLIFGYADPYHYSFKYKNMNEATRFVIKKIKELFPS